MITVAVLFSNLFREHLSSKKSKVKPWSPGHPVVRGISMVQPLKWIPLLVLLNWAHLVENANMWANLWGTRGRVVLRRVGVVWPLSCKYAPLHWPIIAPSWGVVLLPLGTIGTWCNNHQQFILIWRNVIGSIALIIDTIKLVLLSLLTCRVTEWYIIEPLDVGMQELRNPKFIYYCQISTL